MVQDQFANGGVDVVAYWRGTHLKEQLFPFFILVFRRLSLLH